MKLEQHSWIIIWLLHHLVEASFDLFRYLLLGDQLKAWELHPLVPYTSCMNKKDGVPAQRAGRRRGGRLAQLERKSSI